MKRIFLTVVVAGSLIAGCSGGAEGETEDKAMPEKEAASMGNEAEEAVPMKEEEVKEVALTIDAVGETMTTMAYAPKQVSVPAGALVTLTLNNTATAEAMIHNLVIIEAGKQTAVAEAALEAGNDNGYLPDASMYIAATSMANPGETVEVQFTAPEKKGTYQFICTYPGHTSMKGLFLVK